MKIILILLFLPCLASGLNVNGHEYTDKNVVDMEEGLAEWRDFARKAPSMPPEKAIPELGLGIRKTAEASIYLVGDRIGVFKELQTDLLAIPGHAEFYRDRIDRGWQADEEHNKEEGQANKVHSPPDEAQMYAFQTLRQLPSGETLRVLGEMLSDERGRIQVPVPEPAFITNGYFEQHPNCDLAVKTLREMIENPPPQKQHDYRFETDLQPWRTWYEQVKEGRRTVRFKGDPQEYSLKGPVNYALNPSIPRAAKRPGPSEEAAKVSRTPTDLSSAVPWVIGTAIVAIGGCYWFYQGRKSRPGQ